MAAQSGAGRPSPKASDEDKAIFRTLVPDDERITVRPMFGAVAAFVNGLMFAGLFADDLFVRLDDADTARITAAGGGPLEPMPGKPMRGYVTVRTGAPTGKLPASGRGGRSTTRSRYRPRSADQIEGARLVGRTPRCLALLAALTSACGPRCFRS